MSDLDYYLQQNKQFVYDHATQNTKYNDNGQAVISKDDEWMSETEWDEFWKKVSRKELESVK